MNDATQVSAAPPAGDHAGQVRALFDTKATAWPGKYGPGGRLAGRLTQLADAVAGLVAPGGRVLDLGCGSGELARRLADARYQVTGCDIAPRMLHQAEAADQRQAVSWIRLDPRWRTLPCATGSRDAVVAASVLEYVRDPAAVLAECARVLRPGGVLVCTVPNLAHPVRWLEWPVSLAARTPLARPARGVPGRAGQYLVYLRTSRQRGPARWWRAMGGQAGLELSDSRPRARRESLRLLVFTRSGDAGGHSPAAKGGRR